MMQQVECRMDGCSVGRSVGLSVVGSICEHEEEEGDDKPLRRFSRHE